MAVCQNLVPLVNIKIAGKWMFIPLKMVLIGIDPYPYGFIILNTGRWFVSINGFYKSRGSMCGAGPTLEDHLGQNTRTTLQPLILLIQNPTKAIKPTWNLYVYIYTLQTPISNIYIYMFRDVWRSTPRRNSCIRLHTINCSASTKQKHQGPQAVAMCSHIIAAKHIVCRLDEQDSTSAMCNNDKLARPNVPTGMMTMFSSCKKTARSPSQQRRVTNSMVMGLLESVEPEIAPQRNVQSTLVWGWKCPENEDTRDTPMV